MLEYTEYAIQRLGEELVEKNKSNKDLKKELEALHVLVSGVEKADSLQVAQELVAEFRMRKEFNEL